MARDVAKKRAYARLSSTLVAFPQLVGELRLQRPELDEAWGRGLREELFAGLREARQLGIVDGVRRGTGDDPHAAFVEAQADLPRHPRVHRVHVGVEVFAQRLPPQSAVDEIAPLLIHPRLELVL